MAFDRFRESCGVVAVSGVPEAARFAYLGLHALQHRGQEAAGIASWDGEAVRNHRGAGLVDEVFAEADMVRLEGQVAIGHNRYSTAGDSSQANIQPLVVLSRMGALAVAHNGNFVNAAALREQLEARGSILQTSADTEVILHLMAASRQDTVVNRLVDALYAVEGAYSMVLLHEGRVIAVRDPWGFRPLVLGQRDEGWVVASESCALALMGARLVREVEPGEMLIIEGGEVVSLRPLPRRPRKACVFEHIYFSRPDSEVFGVPVYERRKALGRQLAQEQPATADVVIAVPDSGIPGALGYAEASGLPYQVGLLRSHYVGRTFIEPSQQIRDFGVKLKHAPVRSVLEGKRVVVVDDSLVRGTTARKIVRMLQDCGAREVHLRITAPPTTGSCFYGVDTPDPQELLAARLTRTEIQTWLGVDSLGYLSLEGLRAVQDSPSRGFCEACFSGEYPLDPTASSEATQVGLFERSS